MDTATYLGRSHEIGTKIALIYQKRMRIAMEGFGKRVNESMSEALSAATGAKGAGGRTEPAAAGTPAAGAPAAGTPAAFDPWSFQHYAIDAFQRSILFWDTLRQRGDNFLERASKGSEPVLHFDYETVLDGRTFERPVNYTLLRITPPPGVTTDPARRPYIIIDPRAGHGPGIGGFKDDSQAGVAMRAGHPVYFVSFFRDPVPGQTLLDVCTAEQQFVKHVRTLHPASKKPVIVGNCQGGWAAMMLASSSPDDTGPILINGAPMAYTSGAWSEGEGDNPMRYAGGMLGGTWLSSFTADLGNGVFDGAHLIQNFESLNPANTLWDKYYKVYKNADTEPARYLDFERWWGTYYLLNAEEIEFITRNLFIGNKLWSGDVKGASGQGFDLRDIQMPIVLFASMGDNITPPEQAFNWVADIYGSTDEIKARGQVIVGLLHPDVGHLGIFVSGKVAKKEYTQLVSVLNEVELLPPGLYAMEITDVEDQDGKPQYEVTFHERRLEDVSARLNRLGRVDEQPFEAVAALSDFNQRAYQMFAQPLVRAMSNDTSAKLLRQFHPLRVQNWALSSLNPWMAWLKPAAEAVREHRQPVDSSDPLRRLENAGAELVSASLDLYRGLRDATTEARFFGVYANLYAFYLADKQPAQPGLEAPADVRALPFVQEALGSIAEGGYAEAFARLASLRDHRQGELLPLSRLVKRKELAKSYAEYLPDVPLDQWRRLRGEQEIITRYEPEQAIASLPILLRDPGDRERLLTLIEKLMTDKRVQATPLTDAQLAMVDRLCDLLDGAADHPALHRPGFAPVPPSPDSPRLH